MIVAMSVVAGLGLSGCTVGPDYRKPAITLEGFHSAAAVQAHSTRTSAAALDRWWLGLHAVEDVENAFTSLVQLEAHTQELEREVAALKRARDSSRKAYAAGVIPLTDVLDADRQLLAAQDQLALTRANTDQAAVQSFRAIGGGWGS
jgi:outer membrane protein TolC